MAIDPKLLVIKPVDELESVTGLQAGDMLFYDGSGNLKRISIETFNNLSKTAKPLKPTDTTPTIEGLYAPTESGTYSNAGGLIVQDSYYTQFYFDGTTWTKAETKMPAKINNWAAGSYNTGDQVIHLDSIYEANAPIVSSDIPGTSSKWDMKVGGGSESKKVVFNSVIKFNEKRKFSTINQTGNISFTYDASGTELDSIYQVYIVSDGTSDLSFSSDFEVIGLDTIDKTKNQDILFPKPALVEFKIPAIIMNVAKSGNITPVDLDSDAQAYVTRIQSAGGVISTPLIYAINDFFLSAKANGYFTKLKGLWLAIGSNTASRLVNAITSGNAATLEVGSTVSSSGFLGAVNLNLIPSSVLGLNDFSFAMHNTTAAYSNNVDFGSKDSSTACMYFRATATTGQQNIHATLESGGSTFANADSLGAYIVSRTASNSLKAYKNGSLVNTNTTAQTGSSLPNGSLYGGARNDNGVVSFVSTRNMKYYEVGLGLTDDQALNFNNDISTLMTAIGR